MVGDLLDLVSREAMQLANVVHAPSARELGGRRRVEKDVVIEPVLARVGEDARDDWPDRGNLTQLAQVRVVYIQISQHQNIIFAPGRLSDYVVDLGQCVEFLPRLIGIGMNVHEHKRKGFLRRDATCSEHGDQRLAVQHVVWVAHGVNAAAVYFYRGRVEEERILFLATGPAQPWPNNKIVFATATLIDIFQKSLEVVFVFGTNFLNRHDVKIANDRAKRLHDVWLARFRLPENLDVERGDTDS